MSAVLPESPYKGLAPFDDSDIDGRFFFGREREAELVADNLVASRLTVLYGPSGVGKSSLLRAGVLRRLRALVPAGGGDGEGALPVLVDDWRDDPIGAIAAAAGARAPASPEELADALAERVAEVGGELYLVLDQLEEYFVYHGHARGGPLRDALGEILARGALRVHILLGIRDDALAELDGFKGRVPGLFGNVLRLDHLDGDAARAAIVEPLAVLAALGGPRVVAEPALVAAVVDQVASGRIERRLAGRGMVPGGARRGRIEAPYLQLVLDRVWSVERERGSSVLRASTLAELGGAGRIVQEHLERALAKLGEPERELVARLFHQLVTPSGTKIAHAVGDLGRYAGEQPERLDEVLHALSIERVVRVLPARNGGGPRYEIFHDVLADAVLDWRARHEAERELAAERVAARRRLRRLGAFAGLALVALAVMGLLTAYAFEQRSEARQQARTAEAQRTAAERNADAAAAAQAESERNAARADAEAERANEALRVAESERDEARRQRLIADAATAEATQLAASEADARRAAEAAEADAVASEQEATQQRDVARAAVERERRALRAERAALRAEQRSRREAESARELAEARSLVAQAVSLLAVDPERSLQLALRSADRERTAELERALRDGLTAARARRILPGGGGAVGEVVLSRDGTLALVPSASGAARVFELASGKLLTEVDHGTAINAAAILPGEAQFLTAGRDGAVRRWRLSDGQPAGTIAHGAAVRDVAVTPDGLVLAVATAQSVHVWSLDRGVRLRTLPHPFAVSEVSFDAGGRTLLTVARDLRVFEAGSWQLRGTLDETAQFTTAELSPAGDVVAAGGRGGLATLWTWASGASIRLRGHGADVTDVAWSPAGDLVGTASADNSARVWTSGGALASVLAAHTNQARSIAFAPDGNSIATGGLDGSGQIATGAPSFPRSARLLGHSAAAVNHVVFTPDGRSLVTSSADGSARVWRAAVDPVARVVITQRGDGRAVAVTRDGSLIVSGGLDATIQVARRDGTLVRSIAHPGAVLDVAVSPDGAEALAAGADGTARVYALATGRLLRSFVHGAPLRAAVYDGSGERVATAGADGIARVWRRADGSELRQVAHGAPLTGLAFSPDGGRLATAGEDPAGRVWRLADGRLLGTLVGHEDDLTSIAYSRDGKLLVTGSLDADARVWDAATFASRRLLAGHTAVVSDAVFSPDGRWIATAGPTTIGLWETHTGRRIDAASPVLFIRGHTARVRGVAFAPDSRRIVSTGDDDTVRTYLCELCGTAGQLVRVAERRLRALGANLTPAERARHLGD